MPVAEYDLLRAYFAVEAREHEMARVESEKEQAVAKARKSAGVKR